MTAHDAPMRRWRLVLGGGDAEGTGVALDGDDAVVDRCLGELYDSGESASPDRAKPKPRRGGLQSSAPRVARWLGDVRRLFPVSVVRMLQKDALERLGIERMLLEPELLAAVQPDVHLVATLISLKSVIPARSKETARAVVRNVVAELLARIEQPTRAAVQGSLRRAMRRQRRPRHNELDWNRTILRNLKHYIPERKTLIPEQLIGYGKQRSSMRDLILCVDESGSMAGSVVYASIFGAVLASIPALRTRLVVFDTAVVDLTDQLQDDPVDLLFGIQLGGGTDINRALAYCQGLVERPEHTTLVLLSDLMEGGNGREMRQRAASLVASGVQVVVLLALDDEGAPWHDHEMAAALAALGIPCFACTPDVFPDLMAAALARLDLHAWAAQRGIALSRDPR